MSDKPEDEVSEIEALGWRLHVEAETLGGRFKHLAHYAAHLAMAADAGDVARCKELAGFIKQTADALKD